MQVGLAEADEKLLLIQKEIDDGGGRDRYVADGVV